MAGTRGGDEPARRRGLLSRLAGRPAQAGPGAGAAQDAKAAPAKAAPAKAAPAKAAPAKAAATPAKAAPAKSASAKAAATGSTRGAARAATPAGGAKVASAAVAARPPAAQAAASSRAKPPAKPPAAAAGPAAAAQPSAAKAAPAKAAPAKAAAKAPAKGRPREPLLPVLPGDQPWTAAEVAAVRAELEGELAELRRELDEAASAYDRVLHEGGEGAGDDQADAGTATFEREQEMSLANNSRELLAQVERALSRLADGSYGSCEVCGNPIGKARLLAFPKVTMCVACKQREARR